MAAVKPLAVSILLLGMGTLVRAEPITWPIGLDNWLVYVAGQSDGGGSAVAAPISSSTGSAPVSSFAAVTPTIDSATASAPATAQLRWNQAALTPPPTVVANAPSSFNQPASTPPLVSTSASAGGSASSPTGYSGPVNAFLNLGNGPYPLQSAITTGNALPWYDSSHIASFFGGQPTAQQIQSFDNTILQRVQQTFSQSSVAVTLTDNPNVAALHTISLVSNTASASLSSAIGMTQVGANGFSFIDQISTSAQTLDQLEWIVAHNISHELMLAFGVPEKYDQSGNYVDSKLANWSMMVNASSTFSPAAAQALSMALASQNKGNATYGLGAQEFNSMPAAVPEPATLALWVLTAVIVIARRNGGCRRAASSPT